MSAEPGHRDKEVVLGHGSGNAQYVSKQSEHINKLKDILFPRLKK